MKAKDTVISRKTIGMSWDNSIPSGVTGSENIIELFATQLLDRIHVIAQAQAEISFKAGMKEVVEFIQKDEACFCNSYYMRWKITLDDWRAKLKEWGL